MDRVRFGRALGFGTRQAFKTLATAVDAATADNPRAAPPQPKPAPANNTGAPVAGSPAITTRTTAARPLADTPTRKAAHSAARAVVQTRQAKQRFGQGSRRFGEAVWKPFVRLSGVLWLEVTGVFFGLFAVLALVYLWRLYAASRAGTLTLANRHSLEGAAIIFALFGYFCVSSFLRARRRERRR
jgi:hypothetical protein